MAYATNPKILAEINTIESDYYDSPVSIIDGLPYKQYDKIKVAEFYSNSQYLNGQRDSQGRDKPYYNIQNGLIETEGAAIDIDMKDIQLEADSGQHYDKSFLASKDVYQWMKKVRFSKTLNEIRDTYSRYGGVMVKKCFIDIDGEKTLKIEVPAWKNIITDQVDIKNGVKIEKHWMSPSELAEKMDTWENVKESMKLATKRRSEKGDGGIEDVSTQKVPIREIRGEFQRAFYKEAVGEEWDEDDKFEYSHQHYIIAGDKSGKEYLLWCEENDEEVYKYLARKPKPGRGLGVGVIEETEEAQVWTNDAVQKQQRAFEYSSRFVGQSASKKLKGRNVLTEVEDGQILDNGGEIIQPVQIVPSGGMAQFQSVMEQWYAQAEKVTSSYAAQRGEAPPSGTPFRLQASILQQSNSVFMDLRDDLGIFITEIFEDWVLPEISKEINREHILAHEFSIDELKELDKNFATHRANDQAIEKILSGEIVDPEEYTGFMETVQELNKQTKSYRFIDIPKDYYKDLKAKVTVITTGEQKNKAAMMESLYNLLTAVASNPAILQDPVLSQLFMKIVEMSGAGISPVQITSAIQQQAKQAALAAPTETPAPQQMSLQANPTPQLANA